MRVSRALNYSGIIIPDLPGKTLKGADGKNYFLGAKNLNEWMKKTFGPPTHHLTQTQGGAHGVNFAGLLSGKKGIYSMVSNKQSWGSGHADIIDNSTCATGCHFDGPVSFIDIWVLQ